MKIYTRTGDSGQTGLYGGGRVPKDHARINAYGALDELNSLLGVVRAHLPVNPAGAGPETAQSGFAARLDGMLAELQNRLFDLGAELATPTPDAKGVDLLREADVAALERAIDEHEAGLAPLKQFILPGGCPAAAYLHQARCVCRRAERLMVTLAASEPIRELPVCYANRLSDLLFVLARAANHASGQPDVPWSKRTD